MGTEIWKDIKGYEDLYQVSNKGQVKSMDAFTSGKTVRKKKGVILKPALRNGYPSVALSIANKKKSLYIHRLVAEAFLLNEKNNNVINHIDADRTNNDVSNLEWVTQKENVKHAWSIGRMKKPNANKNGLLQGENSYRAILTESNVEYIRKNCKRNGGNSRIKDLCEMFGVNSATIHSVIKNKNWKHIVDDNKKVENYVLSKTGFKYVFSNGNRFQGQFSYNKKKYHCGSFATPDEAYEAVFKKRKELGLE